MSRGSSPPPATPPATPGAADGGAAASPGRDASELTVLFPSLEPLQRWGGALAEAVAASVRAAEDVLSAFQRRQADTRAAVAQGKEPPRAGALSPYREALLGQLVVERLREDARRLDAIIHTVRLAAPTGAGGRTRGRSLGPSATPGRTAGTDGSSSASDDAPFRALWPLVAKHVKHDLAVLTQHVQFDTAILHAALLPLRSHDAQSTQRAVSLATGQNAGDSRVALIENDEAALGDADAALVAAVSDAHALYPGQYLAVCQDALEVGVWAVESRIRLEAQITGESLGHATTGPSRSVAGRTRDTVSASSGLALPTAPVPLAEGTGGAALDEHPDASISEENAVYARLSQRHASPELAQLGAAVGRVETLAPAQVELLNHALADVVVGVFHLYNVLVATFLDYQREAGQYHRVRAARDALKALAAEHLGGPLSDTARSLALLVGESVAAADAAQEDIAALRRWAPSCVDRGLPSGNGDGDGEDSGLVSEVSHRRTLRLARLVPREVQELVDLLAELLASCGLALERHCEPMARHVNATLESHAAALLPLAQAVATVASDLRAVEHALTRELASLRSRCPTAASKDWLARSLLMAPWPPEGARGTADPELELHHDALKNPHRVAGEECGRRCDVLAAVINNAKHAIMQVPPALSGLLRTTAAPAALRPAGASRRERERSGTPPPREAEDLRGSVELEVGELSATLDEALASLHRHRAASRVADAVAALQSGDTGAIPEERAAQLRSSHVNFASVLRKLDGVIGGEFVPTNASRAEAGQASGNSPRRHGGLTGDQAVAASVLRSLLELYSKVERQVLRVAADSFAESSSDELQAAQREFTALVGFVESLGHALYLDPEQLRRIGAPAANMEHGLRHSAGI